MRICAVSDVHGRLSELKIPACDVLVIAGDLAPDVDGRVSQGDPDLMKLEQRNWLREDWAAFERTVDAQHIVGTPGNHDWFDSAPDELRLKIYVDEEVVIDGKRFYFTPWVPPSWGCWNLPANRRQEFFAQIPYKLDLLVSHGPAWNCLDNAYGDVLLGCRHLRAEIKQKQPRHVVTGHIHETRRYKKEDRLGGSKVYNVSMWGQNFQPLVLDI